MPLWQQLLLLWVQCGAVAACGKAATGATGAWLKTETTSSACECQRHCSDNSRCRAWQWMAPSPSSAGSHLCYLKSQSGLAHNGASTAAELPRPPPPPPPPPHPPPPSFATRVSVAAQGSRQAVRYGYGNELCYQSLNDSRLTAAVAASGGAVGRYPGGTPSDYWSWDTGWASDLSTYEGPRRATPSDWAGYAEAARQPWTVFDTNQLTHNLSYAIAGLKAHQAAGSVIKYVELGNEMYDGSRADVVQAYPNGSVYAHKMASWTAAIKQAFPQAQVALIGCRWNAYRKPREDNWNRQVLQDPVSAQADAATLHIYCPLDESNNASDPANVAAHLSGAFTRALMNKQHVELQVPARMRIWVTEMGVYPAGPLLWTWLEALFYAILDLELPRIERLDVLVPYCLNCGDPTASSFIVGSEKSTLPPASAGTVPWLHSLTGHAQSIIFTAAKNASAMTPLSFSSNPVLDPKVATSRALLGWRFSGPTAGGQPQLQPQAALATVHHTYVVANVGAAAASLDLSPLLLSQAAHGGGSGSCSYRGSFPRRGADITRAGMLVSELGVLKGDCGSGVPGGFVLPGYGVVSISSRHV